MANVKTTFELIDKISDKLNSISESGEKAVAKLENAATASDRAFSTASKGAAETARALGDTGDAIDGLQTPIDKTGEQFEKYSEKTKKSTEETEKFGEKTKEAIEGLENLLVSAGIVKMLGKIGDAFSECSAKAEELEISVATVATIADKSQLSMSEINSQLLESSYALGKSATGITDAAYQAISAGVETVGAVSFAADATKLAVGGFTSAATSVDVLTTAINAYNLETDRATYISDILVTTQNLGKTTVDQLAANMGRVIPLASAYNVQMDNLSSAYAIMTANGIATAETTTYVKSMLNELGQSSSNVAKVLKEQTGKSFADLMEEGYSLGDVMDILGISVDGNTTAFSGLWGSVEAGIGALSLFNSGSEKYNDVLDQMQNSAGATEKAYRTMADTTAYAHERMDVAMENLQISIGNGTNPALEQFYNWFASILEGVGTFLDENPAVTAALVGVTVAVGGVVLVVTGYTVAMKVARIATTAFGKTLVALSAHPVVAAVAGLAILATAIGAVVAIMNAQDQEVANLTATSRKQYYELQDLNSEYEYVCDKYGETSYQAQELKIKQEELSKTYEASKQSLEEYNAYMEAVLENHNAYMDTYTETTSNIQMERDGCNNLIERLEYLATAETETAEAKAEMLLIIDSLNKKIPNLSLSYDTLTTSVVGTLATLKMFADEQAKTDKAKADKDAYLSALKEQEQLEEAYKKATEEYHAMYEEYMSYNEVQRWANWDGVSDKYYAALESFNNAADALNQNSDIRMKYITSLQAEQDALEEERKAFKTYEEAIQICIEASGTALGELAARYDEAYNSARESIDGQIGLFDKMTTESELSVKDMGKNLDSQAEFLNKYTENLRKAQEYGFNEELVAKMSDGSAESAGYINELIERYEKLGTSTSEAAAFVDEMNGKYEAVGKAKDDYAAVVANMQTDFTNNLDEVSTALKTSIDGMNMETDAAEAAKKTIDAYINAIRNGATGAASAAEAVTNATVSVLERQYTGMTDSDKLIYGTAGYVPAHATGTTSAEDVFIAGEKGPELIVGKGGSTVFPTSETNKLLNSSDKKITLEINGSGSIGVDKGTSKEEILAVMIQNIKPVLVDVISTEIFEEGDESYEY